MNDRLPGSCYSNPIWEGQWRIYCSDLYEVHGYEYDYVHDNYDGAEDAGDNRCGHAHSIEEAKKLIAEHEDI